MGIGLVFIVEQKSSDIILRSLKKMTKVYEIGEVVAGDNIINYV